MVVGEPDTASVHRHAARSPTLCALASVWRSVTDISASSHGGQRRRLPPGLPAQEVTQRFPL